MNKKRKLWIGITAVLLIVLALGVGVGVGKVKEDKKGTKSESQETKAGKDKKNDVDSADEEEAAEGDSDGGSNGGASLESTSGSSTEEGTTASDGSSISFPYKVPDSKLVIDKISSYDGVFIEDGSDEAVEGITTILLKNTGKKHLEYVELTMNRGEEVLTFQASSIPAGATVAVQEAARAAYVEGQYQNCYATTAAIDKFEKSKDQVKVEELEDGSLRVTNLTKKDIPCVRLFYKLYMKDEKIYIGGITYTAKITNLAAGESQDVTPSHYSKGNSKIMMIRTYETAE